MTAEGPGSGDAAVLPWLSGWLAPGTGGTNAARAYLNNRHAEILRRYFPDMRPPVGLLADLADLTGQYAQVAAREAVKAERSRQPALFDLEAS